MTEKEDDPTMISIQPHNISPLPGATIKGMERDVEV